MDHDDEVVADSEGEERDILQTPSQFYFIVQAAHRRNIVEANLLGLLFR